MHLNIFILILLLFAPFSVYGEAGLTVSVLQDAVVEGEVIFFKDISEIAGEDKGLTERLKAVRIGRSPAYGKTRTIDINLIRDSLDREGIDSASLNLSSVAPVNVTRRFIKVSREKIETIFTGFIQHKVFQDDSRIVIKNIRCPQEVILPPGKITYEIDYPRRSNFLGKVSISILFSSNKKFQKKVWVNGTVEILQNVICATRPLKRHQLIKKGDIHTELKNLGHLSRDVMVNLQEAVGKRTKKAIDINVPLRACFLEFPPLVKRGDLVTILAESGTFLIKTIGEVLERGEKGKLIKVVNITSKKGIYARIVDSNTVRVEF